MDAGNIVRNQTDPIVVIAQVQPIDVIFTLPQQQLLGVNSGLAAGSISAEALTTDGGKVLDTGKLQVVDNQVDPTTGTVKFKAEFPNGSRQLWPGQFVSFRLKVKTLKSVVVVPTAAIQQGPTGSFVYLAEDDNSVSVRPVTATQTDGDRTVIAKSLVDGDEVVTTGFSRLKDGARFSTAPSKDTKPAGAAPPPPDANTPAAQLPAAANTMGSTLAEPAAAAEGPAPGLSKGSSDPANPAGKHLRHKTGANGKSTDASANAPGTTQ